MEESIPAPIHVLLVADTEATLIELAPELMQAGLRVAVVQDTAQVMKEAARQYWDAVVIELQPIEATIELVAELYQHWPTLSTLILASHDHASMIETGLRAGAYDWLFTPLSLPLLHAALERARERRALRRQLMQPASASNSQAIKQIAHDINNHLSGIIGLIQLYLTDPLLPPELRTDLEGIVESSRHIGTLTEQLRAL